MSSGRRALILVIIAALVSIAAAFKLYAEIVDAPSVGGFFSRHAFNVLVINLEFLLALWIISTVTPSLCWLTTVTVFLCFAAVSLYQALTGQSSCGCFGKIPIHPWISFSLDLFVLAMLVLSKPTFQELTEVLRTNIGKISRTLAIFFAIIFAVSTVAISFGVYYFGSMESALANIRGKPIVIIPSNVDLGTCNYLENKDFTIRIVNYTRKPIRIVGQARDCCCTTTSEFPVLIPSNDEVELKMTVGITTKDGPFMKGSLFFVDVGHLEKLHFGMKCIVGSTRTGEGPETKMRGK